MASDQGQDQDQGQGQGQDNSNQPRIISFGRKLFKLTNLEEYFKKTEKYIEQHKDLPIREIWDKFDKEYPYYNIFDIEISSCFDTKTKQFYNHACGMIGNCGGDFFWDSKHSLEILRTRGVPEKYIPSFLKNYQEIEKRFLAGKDYYELLINKKKQSYIYIHWFLNENDQDNDQDNDNESDEEESEEHNVEHIDKLIIGFAYMLKNLNLSDEEKQDLEQRKQKLEMILNDTK